MVRTSENGGRIQPSGANAVMKPKDESADLGDFVRLLTEHQAAIRGYIRALIPQEADINDVLQNTNMFLWERRAKFEVGSNFKAWAFAITRFRVMEHIHRLRRENRITFDAGLIQLLDQACLETPNRRIDAEYSALEHCLGLLNHKDRALIDARYGSRTPLADYARCDGRTEASLRVILNRLRVLLRRCMNQQLELIEE